MRRFKRTHPAGVLAVFALAWIVCMFASPVLAGAQQQVALERGPRFMVPEHGTGKSVEVDVTRVMILRRRVSLNRAGATVLQLLHEISTQTGIEFAYEPGTIPVSRIVGLRADSITIAAALTEILVDAGVDVLLKSTRQAVLLKRTLPGKITGKVTDGKTRLGVIGAEVFLAGTRWRALTDTTGRYRIADVEPGSYTLTVRRLGYAKQSQKVVTHGEQEDTVDVVLEPVAARLQELVTTATGRQRRRDVPNDITTINADSVMQAAPVHSLTDLLENRVPGLTVQRTSGAPGDPARLRLRGAGSPLQNNDPIVVVDGVRVYARQSDGRSSNLASNFGNTDKSGPYGRFAAPSPLDYIDPNSVEAIEVVKGPSAAALYGPDAANGVIVVTTKKGRAGPTRWTMSAAHGRTQMAGRYPDLLFRWGHQLYDPVNGFCPLNSPVVTCAGDSVLSFQMLNDPTLTILDKGHSTDLSLGASGGTKAVTYSITGSFGDELGLVKLPDYEAARYQTIEGRSPPDWMRRPQALRRWGATSSINAQLGAKGDVTLTTSLSRTRQQRSTLEQQLGDLMSTFLDRSSGLYYSGTAGFFDMNSLSGATATSYNVALYRMRVTDVATQFTNGVNANWRVKPWLTMNANAGLDVQQRADETLLPRSRDSLYLETPRGGVAGTTTGLLQVGTGTVVTSTVNAGAVAIAPLGRGFSFRVASGVNYTGTSIDDGNFGECLAYGSSNPIPCRTQQITTFPARTTRDDATFGWSLAPELVHPRFAINLGLQLTGGSRYGSSNGLKLPSFPKLGFSYLLSDEPFFPLKNLFQSFRVRVAYGRAGRQPGPADRLRLYNTVGSTSIGDTVTLKTLGNTDLRPERTAEFEGGIDADLLDSRVNVLLTGYRKTTEDALLNTPVPPSVYGLGASIVRNIGVIRNAGVELEVNTQLIRSSVATVSTRFSLQHDRNKVVRLGPGVLPFYTDGVNPTTGVGGSGIRVAAGYPLFGRWTRPVLGYADVNGNGVLEPSEILLGDTAVYVGETTQPDQLVVQPTVSLWHGALTVTAGLTHVGGVSQKNEVAQRLAPFSHGSNDSTASLAEQLATGLVGKNLDFNWIQTVTTTRFDDLSVRYAVPSRLARRLGAQQLSIAVQGSNLGLWTNYRGLDPNVNAFPTGNSVTDTGVLPMPRTWQVRINANY